MDMKWTAEAAVQVRLGHAKKGFISNIQSLLAQASASGLPAAEMERLLIELGFVEGARVQILHEGFFGRDPIAVRGNGATVALRRREAMAVIVC